MKNYLIGSRALNFWYPDCKIKDTTDWDVVSFQPIEGTEWHNPNILLNSELEQYDSGIHVIKFGLEFNIINRTGLAIIKRSHLWRDLAFGKHITHWDKYLSEAVPYFTEEDKDYLKRRTAATMQMFPQMQPNLNQTVSDFFDDAVEKKYNHDWLHELFAYQDKPLYTKLQSNPELAWCEKDKWQQLSRTEQLQCVAEETCVIATERFLVPSEWSCPARLAYFKALQKVCTTLCSGWFRDCAIDNHAEICDMFDQNKFDSVKLNIEKEN